ncbi:MAG TPA: hypothetical protein VGM91_05765 [Conexibacter sp.]|jgi:hypothetical protein
MSASGTRLPHVEPPKPAARSPIGERAAARRRRAQRLRPLAWVVTAGLGGLLVALATGLIQTEVDPTGTPASVVPHRVDPTQGFGKPSSYTGRYEVRGLRSVGGGEPAEGSLLLFLRSESPDDLLLPSGTLSLSTGRGNFVGYVTDMHVRSGGAISADIRGGTFQGPVIGSMRGTASRAGMFTATVKAPGIGAVTGEFVRVARTSGYAQAQPLP